MTIYCERKFTVKTDRAAHNACAFNAISCALHIHLHTEKKPHVICYWTRNDWIEISNKPSIEQQSTNAHHHQFNSFKRFKSCAALNRKVSVKRIEMVNVTLWKSVNHKMIQHKALNFPVTLLLITYFAMLCS